MNHKDDCTCPICQIPRLEKTIAEQAEQIEDLMATATEWAKQVEEQKVAIDTLRKLKEHNEDNQAGTIDEQAEQIVRLKKGFSILQDFISDLGEEESIELHNAQQAIK